MAKVKPFPKQVADLKAAPAGKRTHLSVPGGQGLYVRVTDKGKKTFTVVARRPSDKKQKWAAVPFDGDMDALTDDDLDDVRRKAREGVANIRAGREAFPPPPEVETLRKVAEDWLKRHVRKNKLITAPKIERTLERLVFPALGDRPITDIKRSEIVALMDRIEDQNGDTMADRTLEYLRSMLNWYERRHDDFVTPIRRGMARVKPSERKRNRVLSEQEIRLMWPILEKSGAGGGLFQILLLTAAREAKVQQMRWRDIDNEGVWTIPEESKREKANAKILPLPKFAIAIIERQTRIVGNPFVFASTRTDHYWNGFSRFKKNLDETLLAALKAEAAKAGDDPKKVKLEPWVPHSLRHTAKTLMSRLGVPDFDSERTLGHAIRGISGHYDHDIHFEQKREALQMLADAIERIVRPVDATRAEAAE